jgi:hypothetical protein
VDTAPAISSVAEGEHATYFKCLFKLLVWRWPPWACWRLALVRRDSPHGSRRRHLLGKKWTNKEAEQMKQIVNDFNNTVGKEKGIFVEYLSMSSINQKTLVSTAAGVPPDVAGVWDAQGAAVRCSGCS